MKTLSANELRIGNLVYYHVDDNIEGEYDVVNTIDYEDIRIIFGNGDDAGYKPIPLTEEWLLKLGFKAKKVLNLYDRGFILKNVLASVLYLRPSYQGGYYWGFYVEDSEIVIKQEHEFYAAKPVKTVHELQNLYFALTGEELTVKDI